MAIEHFVKVTGSWRSARTPDSHFVKVGGVWRAPQGTDEKFIKVNGQWRSASASNPPPSPGTYFLAPISQSLTGGSGFSDYNTTEYRGNITEIRARVTWKPQAICVAGLDFQVSGRPNGNFYRTITSDGTFCGRTIDHRIDTFDATSLTDFNNGDATGFSYSTAGLELGNGWSNVQLGLTIV